MPGGMKWVVAFAVGLGLIALGWKVPFVLTTMFVLICFLLIVVVLLQSGKAADLAGAFGGAGSQTAFGPRGAATFLSRATTWCAVMFMLTSVALGVRRERPSPTDGSVLQKFSKPAPKQPSAPAPTTPAPQQQPTAPPQQPPAQQQSPQTPSPPASKQ